MSGGGDHGKFQGFVRRVLRAYSRRVADADPEDLAELLVMRQAVDDAITAAIAGMRERGVSWAAIATATGTTKQAAQQRYGVKVALMLDGPGVDGPGRRAHAGGIGPQRAAHSPTATAVA